MPDTAAPGVRRALLAGINAYAKKPLDGCIADAQLMAQLLRDRFAFDAANVTVLTDRAASRAALLAELDQLVDLTGPGDTAFFFYAGHGALGPSDDKTEASGQDNTLNVCEDPREDIYDFEIQARLAALGEKTPFTICIFDCCNSGTISRDLGGTGPKERWNVSVPAGARPAPNLGPHAAPGVSRSTDTYTLIAACRDDEIAKESALQADADSHHGALTWALVQELQRATNGATWRDVFDRVARAVTAQFSDQHPQIEGAADREIFGLKEFTPDDHALVTERASTTVVLGKGAAHGVTPGAVYTIHPDGTKHAADTAALGTVTVTVVKGTTSRARIDGEASTGAIVAGARAFPTTPTTVASALAVQNTDPASQLTGKVLLDVLRYGADGTPAPLTPDATAGMPILTAGDRIAFRMTNTTETPLFVNLFVFDPTGTIKALTKGSANQLAAKGADGAGVYEIGIADGRKLRIGWDGDDAVQSFKLWATVAAVDLTYLEELDAAARSLDEIKPIGADDWTTVTVPVLLRKAATPT